jgi:multiple sugar transport system permease protein
MGRMKKDFAIVLFLLAGLLVVAVIIGIPLLHAMHLSLYRLESFISEPSWVGLDNYARILVDRDFWSAFGNGLVIACSSIALQVVLGIGIAMILDQNFIGQSLARGVMILPYLLPTVVACLTIEWLLDGSYGLVKSLLAGAGIRMFDWSESRWSATATIVLVSVWIWTPFVVTCVLAGLQSIPRQLYEAAKVDGAGPWHRFWHVTLPGLKPVLTVVVLLRGIWMFNKFDVVWLLTKGGPVNSTETLPVLAYRKAFQAFDVGGGAAVATISFIILSLVILIYLKLFPLDDK